MAFVSSCAKTIADCFKNICYSLISRRIQKRLKIDSVRLLENKVQYYATQPRRIQSIIWIFECLIRENITMTRILLLQNRPIHSQITKQQQILSSKIIFQLPVVILQQAETPRKTDWFNRTYPYDNESHEKNQVLHISAASTLYWSIKLVRVNVLSRKTKKKIT